MACRYGYKRGQGVHGLDQSRETDQSDGEDDLPGCAFPGRTRKTMRSAEPVVVPSQGDFPEKLMPGVIISWTSHIREFFNRIGRFEKLVLRMEIPKAIADPELSLPKYLNLFRKG